MKTPEQIENERLAPAYVPAGATQKCADCGQYWNARMWPLDPVVDSDCPCTDRRPIAEAVPAETQFSTSLNPAQDGDSAPEAPSATAETASSAPASRTTAAPVEQLSGKVVEGQPPRECAFCDTTEVNGVNINECSSCLTLCCTAHSEDADNQRVLCINCAPEDEPVPAEQPGKADEGDHADDCTDPNCHKRHTIPAGKAADPRPAHPTLPSCDAPEGMAWVCPECQSWATLRENAHAHQIKTGHRPPSMKSRPRPAQPQAPAEPTKHWPDCALNHGGKECDMGPECGAAPTGHTPAEATLREERDRLAGDAAKGRLCEVEQHTSRIHYGTEDNERLRAELAAERAKVAERDARIETLMALLATYGIHWRGAGRQTFECASLHGHACNCGWLIHAKALWPSTDSQTSGQWSEWNGRTPPALGAPEGQPRDYDPMTSPVPEGDMNGPHGPIPAPECQPPAAPSEAPLRLEVRRLAEAFGKAGSEYERGGNTSGAAQLRRVSNLLYALWADGKAEVFTPFTCAEPEAPLDALRRLADKWERMAEGYRASAAGTMVSCARELRDTLSAPPPPPREQELLGNEGGDGDLSAASFHAAEDRFAELKLRDESVTGWMWQAADDAQRLLAEAKRLRALVPPAEQEQPGGKGGGADELREIVKLLLEVIDHAESKDPHSPWCNGVHADSGACEGEYRIAEICADARNILNRSAPPRKAPQEDAWLKGWLAGRDAAVASLTALADEMKARAEAAKASRHVGDPRDPHQDVRYESLRAVHQFYNLADRIRAIPAPSSPEEQLSGKELK